LPSIGWLLACDWLALDPLWVVPTTVNTVVSKFSEKEACFSLPKVNLFYHFSVIFIIIKITPTLTVGLKVPAQHIRDSSLFIICFSNKNALLLEVLQPLMLFVWKLTYLEPYFILVRSYLSKY
jgi:hypothetical protein